MKRIHHILLACLVLAAAVLTASPAGAEQLPSSEVLLPYFEVNLQNASGANTFFAVGNWLDKPVDVEIGIYSNWGIQIAKSNLTLTARQVRNFNLRSWLAGELPNRKLSGPELNHFKAALTGERSPKDKLYYSTRVAPGLAVGYVRVKTLGAPQPDALWGDYYLLDGGQASAEGDALINLDPGAGCVGGCSRHALRFLTSGTFDGGTQVVIVSETAFKPSATEQPADYVRADTLAYDEAGQPLGGSRLRLLPVQVVSAADLGLRQGAGWIDLQTGETSVVAVHYSAKKLFGVALMSYCLPPGDPPIPGLRIEKRTNGEDADAAPGPAIKVGAPVLWEYIVENTGDALLTDVEVSDDDPSISVSCPKTELAPGESMICTGRGTAGACQYVNVGTARAKTPDGDDLSAEDSSHYFGDENAAIDLELLVNGQDADAAASGPTVDEGSKIDWTYVVTNKGDVTLNEIKVSDDKGDAVSCPKASLRPGESMTCTASGSAATGQFGKIGSATGKTSCSEARDEDPGFYVGKGKEDPRISIKKLTNNDDASAGPGKNIPIGTALRWDYIVTNDGKVKLDNIQVTDDKEGAVSCPKSSLQPGESMTCSKTGVAKACQYSNVGSVSATSSGGKAASHSDSSFYFGQTSPALQLETFTNGQDDDASPGPNFQVDTPLTWTYKVTNSGDVALKGVQVADNKVANVSCPKSSLQPGESMTCSASGVAAEGPFSHLGTAAGTADTVCGGNASASDPSHHVGTKPPDIPKPPALKIQKLTNNDDAGAAPGKSIKPGSAIRWDYVVSNIGEVRVDNIKVVDNPEGAVSCPKTSLQPGESMTCSKTGVAKACQYSNTGTVTATSPKGDAASANDSSFYFGQTSPALQVKAYTNGQDGLEIPTGSPVQWTYIVTNTGDVALKGVKVTDDHVTNVSCPKSSLQIGESMTCTASGIAGKGPYSNLATATGTADTVCGGNASASDPSQYVGINLPPPCNGKPSLDSLWPPNHKFVDIQVIGIVDPNGDPVKILITGITQDELVNEKGDGNTGPDGAGVGTSTAQVRSERSGLGDGRVYAIHYSASDNQGGSCTGTVFVGVPHDQRGTPPVDSGQLYDSTVAK